MAASKSGAKVATKDVANAMSFKRVSPLGLTPISLDPPAPDLPDHAEADPEVAPVPDGGGNVLDHLRAEDLMDRIRLVREGIPSRAIEEAGDALGWSKERVYDALRVPRATGDRKIRTLALLNASESERVLGLTRLIHQVKHMYNESGDRDAIPGFDPARWLGEWLDEPNSALGGERPAAFLDTADGRGLVGHLLGAMRAGTFW